MNFKELALELGLELDEFFELLAIFIETSESELDKLQHAIDEGDAERAADAAHSIKGASANLGFMDISSMAKKLEQKTSEKNLQGADNEVFMMKDRLAVLARVLKDKDFQEF